MKSNTQLKVNIATNSSIVILPFSLYFGDLELQLFLNVHKVFRVSEVDRFNRLPDSMKPFSGVFNMDGVPVPVIDIKHYFQPDVDQLAPVAQGAISVPRIVVMMVQNILVGIIVDRTRKVRRQSNAEILPPPDILSHMKFSPFNAVIEEDQGYRYMIDIEAILVASGIELSHVDEDSLPDAKLEGARILLVEDSPFFQTLARRSLERHGAKVRVCSNGQEGLSVLRENDRAFDIILSDIEMPIMNGIEMVRRYKHDVKGALPVLFHSSISNPALSHDITHEGLGEYLLKFEENQVVDKVHEILSARTKTVGKAS